MCCRTLPLASLATLSAPRSCKVQAQVLAESLVQECIAYTSKESRSWAYLRSSRLIYKRACKARGSQPTHFELGVDGNYLRHDAIRC